MPKKSAVEEKKKVVEEIKDKIEKAKSVLIINYSKISVSEDTQLRREFRKNNVDYKVYKNTMVRRAFNELGVKDFDKELNGTTSIAFGADVNTAARITVEQSKKIQDKIIPKCGYIDKTYADKATVLQLASIPGREVLLAKLMGSLKAPITKFAMLLKAIAEKQA